MTNRITSQQMAAGILVFCFLALVLGVFNAVTLSQGKSSRRLSSTSDSDQSSMTEILNRKPKLAFINLSGVITMDSSREGGFFRTDSDAVNARKGLDAAAKDDSIKGVLLRINSPGGTVAMSQELNKAVTRVSRKKPVVVSMGDLAASGGYYTACAADRIIANPGTLTASIGVIISSFDLSKLMNQKLGVEAVTVKTGRFKDIMSPYRKPSDDDKKLLQDLINDSYQEFLRDVIAGRTRLLKSPKEITDRATRIRAIADGRIVTGNQAKAVGLVDEIGDQDYAYTVLDKMAKTRFNLKQDDRLPLKSDDSNFNLIDMLGVGTPKAKDGALSAVVSAGKMLPVSAQYPNQPLWVME